MTTRPKGPYDGKPYSELVGLRKDYAKMAQAGVAARKIAEQQLTMIARAMENCDETPAYEASDHAVLRYLERIKGLDITTIREEMAFECANAKEICGDRIRGISGAIFCLNAEGFITTVLPIDSLIEGVKAQIRVPTSGGKAGHQQRKRRRAVDELLEDLAPLVEEL